MTHAARSIRPFIGAKNFEQSRSFYRYIGFDEYVLTPNMSLFKTGPFGFYLQDYYAKEWIENTMVFLEVDSAERYYNALLTLDLTAHFPETRLMPVRKESWGEECFLIDPAGVLWHFGQFNK